MVAKTNPTRPTREQILLALRECLREEDYPFQEFDADTLFWPFFAKNEEYYGGWLFELLLDFIWPVEKYLGLPSQWAPWEELFFTEEISNPPFKDKAEITFGDIADWIVKQLGMKISFEPAVILGKPCQPAGIFLGMEELAQQVNPQIEKFGPSTRISDCLSGLSLDRYWNLLHWMTDGTAPSTAEVTATRSFWNQVSDLSVLFIAVASNIAWIIVGLPPEDIIPHEWSIGLSSVCFILWVVFIYSGGRWLVERFTSPMPRGITTFRDLAMLICNRMQRAADQVSQNVQVA